MTTAGTAATKIARLLAEIDALIDDDECRDREVSGAWKTFDDINAAANAHLWDAYSIDLSTDVESYRRLSRHEQDALIRVFGTIYRAEAAVDDWMVRIVAAIPPDPPGTDPADGMRYDAMRTALRGQEHDEKMHRDSLFRVGVEVLGIRPTDVEEFARRHNNVIAETLFARFHEQMKILLRPGRSMQDVYVALFIYGVISEDCVANGDVVIRRAKGNSLYDAYHLPGMKLGQTNVRRDEGRHVRIAVIATKRFLAEYADAEERLMEIVHEYLDMADRMLHRAKNSRGLIDAHLRESYGPDVDGLYYYTMNLRRFAVRLDELGLRQGVTDVRERVRRAVEQYTGPDGEPVVDVPGPVTRHAAPILLRLATRRS